MALEGRCRVCPEERGLQAAHVVGREHDAKLSEAERAELGTEAERYVMAIDVVPLCERHHRLYDDRRLDLLPYLTIPEQAAAVGHVGIVSALRRICSAREVMIAAAVPEVSRG